MKSILFIAGLAIASIIGCDTPENSTGNETQSPPMTTDTTMTTPMPGDNNTDTSMTTPTPMDTTTQQ
jgi:hypothetical protein